MYARRTALCFVWRTQVCCKPRLLRWVCAVLFLTWEHFSCEPDWLHSFIHWLYNGGKKTELLSSLFFTTCSYRCTWLWNDITGLSRIFWRLTILWALWQITDNFLVDLFPSCLGMASKLECAHKHWPAHKEKKYLLVAFCIKILTWTTRASFCSASLKAGFFCPKSPFWVRAETWPAVSNTVSIPCMLFPSSQVLLETAKKEERKKRKAEFQWEQSSCFSFDRHFKLSVNVSMRGKLVRNQPACALSHLRVVGVGLEKLTLKEYNHKNMMGPIHLYLMWPHNCKMKEIPKGNVLSHKH